MAAPATDHGLHPSTAILGRKRLSTLPDYHPLVMSIVELKQHVRGHITFNKQDIFWNLGSTTLEAVSQDTVILQGDPVTPSTTADFRDMESSYMEAWEHITPPPHPLDIHPRRRPHQMNPSPCLLRLMSRILCLALQKFHWGEMPWSFGLNLMQRPKRTCNQSGH